MHEAAMAATKVHRPAVALETTGRAAGMGNVLVNWFFFEGKQ
jgi:hypothetical protein